MPLTTFSIFSLIVNPLQLKVADMCRRVILSSSATGMKKHKTTGISRLASEYAVRMLKASGTYIPNTVQAKKFFTKNKLMNN